MCSYIAQAFCQLLLHRYDQKSGLNKNLSWFMFSENSVHDHLAKCIWVKNITAVGPCGRGNYCMADSEAKGIGLK